MEAAAGGQQAPHRQFDSTETLEEEDVTGTCNQMQADCLVG